MLSLFYDDFSFAFLMMIFSSLFWQILLTSKRVVFGLPMIQYFDQVFTSTSSYCFTLSALWWYLVTMDIWRSWSIKNICICPWCPIPFATFQSVLLFDVGSCDTLKTKVDPNPWSSYRLPGYLTQRKKMRPFITLIVTIMG